MCKIKVIMVMFLFTGLLVSPIMAISHEAGAGKRAQTMGTDKEKGQMRERTASNLSTEQRDQIRKLHEKFREDNADGLKQLITKQFDLKTILDSDKPDVEKAKAVQKEIGDLNSKLAQKRIDLFIELRKINPNAKFGAMKGKGLSMKGRGLSMSGMMHKGMGT